MGRTPHSKAQKALLSLFDRASVESAAKRTGFLKRRRKVLPFELILSAVSAFSRGRSTTSAQIWREYSRMTGSDVACKPFQGGDAAIEVHATMSLLSDQLTRVAITPDTAPERPHLPAPVDLRNKLILGDRGCQDHAYGVAVKEAGGHVLMRCQTPNPQTTCFWRDGKKVTMHLKPLLAEYPRSSFDLNANYPKLGLKFRTVSLWIEEKCSRVTLMTTLPRRGFSADKVGELY